MTETELINEQEFGMVDKVRKDLLIVVLIKFICDYCISSSIDMYGNVIKVLIRLNLLHKIILDIKYNHIKEILYSNLNTLFNTLSKEPINKKTLDCSIISLPNLPKKIYKNLLIEKQIGEGGESEVYLVRHITDKQVYALKVSEYRATSKWNTELSIISKLNHINIIRYYTSWIDFDFRNKNSKSYLYTQVELCDVTLSEYLFTENPSFDIKINIIKQIIDGLLYLHTNNVIHRDIKCENILIKKLIDTIQVKISDFGSSKILSTKDLHTTLPSDNDLGTHFYVSPELIKNEDYNNKTDIYSFGIVMYVILSNFKTKMEEILCLEKLTHNNVILPEIQNRDFFINLIKTCIHPNQNERPDTENIKSLLENLT